jgi:hypothetical protein
MRTGRPARAGGLTRESAAMSGGRANRCAVLTGLGIVVSGCASHPELPDPGPCPMNDLPLASFIEEVNRCSSGSIALADAAADNIRLGGALCICTSNHTAFALRWLGIETVEVAPISVAQAGERERRAVQQDSGK